MVQDLQPRPALPLDGRDGEAVWQNCRQRALQRSRPARAVAHWRGARKAERLRRGGAGLRDRRRPLPRAAADCRRCQLSRRPRVGKTGRHRRIRPGPAAQAIAAYTDFITFYPDDKRVADAQKAIVKLKAEQVRGSFEIAKFYEQGHKWAGAVVYYNAVLQLDANSPLAAQARQRIDVLKPRLQTSAQKQ